MRNSAQTTACVILGAGAGSRFGEPKAGAELRPGVRFVDAVAATALECGITSVVAVLPPGLTPPTGVHVAANPNARGEQIESLRLGLARLTAQPVTGALVWPVDHPYVSGATIRAMLDVIAAGTPLIVVPEYGGKHGHPVYFSRDLWRELVTNRSGGAREVVHRHTQDVLYVPVTDAGVLRDIDEKGDMSAGE